MISVLVVVMYCISVCYSNMCCVSVLVVVMYSISVCCRNIYCVSGSNVLH